LHNHLRDAPPKINHHGVKELAMETDHATREGHEARGAGLDVPRVDHLKALAAPIR
jgi:hypothetical protein